MMIQYRATTTTILIAVFALSMLMSNGSPYTTTTSKQASYAFLVPSKSLRTTSLLSWHSKFYKNVNNNIDTVHSSSCSHGRYRRHHHHASNSRTTRRCSVVMRDVSASTGFQLGDTVQVVENVIKGGENLKGRHGMVVETWEKCAVDPTCCCAEVDRNMAIRVEFLTVPPMSNETTTTTTNASFIVVNDENNTNIPPIKEKEKSTTLSFQHLFAEEELLRLA